MIKLSELSGKPYRPSNGTEGDIFMEWFCDRCSRDTEDKPCEIIMLTMAYDTRDPEYPKQWVYDTEGMPICTSFNDLAELPEGVAPSSLAHDDAYRDPNQLQLFSG